MSWAGCCFALGSGVLNLGSRAAAANENDPPAAAFDVRVPFLETQRLQKPELFHFLQGRLEPSLQFGRGIRTAQADVLAGQASAGRNPAANGGRTACPENGTFAWSSAASA